MQRKTERRSDNEREKGERDRNMDKNGTRKTSTFVPVVGNPPTMGTYMLLFGELNVCQLQFGMGVKLNLTHMNTSTW